LILLIFLCKSILFIFEINFFCLLESIGKMNIWIANELIDKEVFQTVIKPENILNSVCLIVVDLSRVIFIILKR